MTPEEKRARNNTRSKAWKLANPERAKELNKIWHKNNADRVREYKRRSYVANIETERAKRRAKYHANREVERARMRAWRARNVEYIKMMGKVDRLANKYGMMLSDYEAMVVKQHGRCAICREKTKVLVVDHDHKTDRVRALLCRRCNTYVGVHEGPLTIKIRRYIAKHKRRR